MAKQTLTQTSPQAQTITQFELARYIALTNQIERLELERNQLESQLVDALSREIPVEPGTHTARLETHERRSVSWKDIVISLKGERYAEAMLASTEPKPYTKLIVR